MLRVRRWVVYAVAAVFCVPGATEDRAGSLCSRLDPQSRLDAIELPPHPIPRGYYSYPQGGREALATLLTQLEHPDPSLRVDAVARLSQLREEMRSATETVDEHFVDLLKRESHVQVVEQVFLSGCQRTNASLAPFLLEGFLCELDDGVCSAAVECARGYPGLLARKARAGDDGAISLLETVYDQVEPGPRRWIADVVLRSLREPNLPQLTEEEHSNCVPRQELRMRQLPFVLKEVTRLLDERNRRYFREVSDCASVLWPLRELSTHLGPHERVALWRRVLELIDGELSSCESSWGRWEPLKMLAKALASRASAATGVDDDGALRDIDEAVEIARRILAPQAVAQFEAVRARVERNRSGAAPSAGSVAPYVGTYKMGTGFTGNRLTLTPKGTYESIWWSDAKGGCPTQPSEGMFDIEGGTIVVTPGPSMQRIGVDAPDVLVPIPRGTGFTLVPSFRMEEFCTRTYARGIDSSNGIYVRASWDDSVPGPPPPQCQQYLDKSP